MVRPLDAAVFTGLYQENRWGARLGRPEVENLLNVVADEVESPSMRLRRLRRYAIVGLDLRAARVIPPVQKLFHDADAASDEDLEDSRLLVAVPAWTRPGTTPRRNAGSWLALASQRMRLPVREVAERAARLVPSDWIPPNGEIIAALGQKVFDYADIALIERSDYSGEHWIDPDVHPYQVVGLSASLGKSVSEVLAAFERLAPLGYAVTERDLIPENLQPIERDALLMVDAACVDIGPLDLMILADRYDLDLQGVWDALHRVQEAGFVSLPALQDGQGEIRPTSMELGIMREILYVWDLRILTQRLANGWRALSRLSSYLTSGEGKMDGDRLAACRRLVDLVDPQKPITGAEVFDLTTNIGGSLADALDFYRQLLPQTGDISLLSPAWSDSDLRAQWEGLSGLINYRRFMDFLDPELRWCANAADVAKFGARWQLTVPALLDRLGRYRDLGAPVPAISTVDRQEFSKHAIDIVDVAMLTRSVSYGRDDSIDAVSPLGLVQIAGRFGWTMTQARTRLARFEPFGLQVSASAEHCDDRIVSWQDLLILTAFLDGQEPALAGPVPDNHLVRAAEETEETVEEVRKRLGRFADLFGFTLQPQKDDAEGSPQDA